MAPPPAGINAAKARVRWFLPGGVAAVLAVTLWSASRSLLHNHHHHHPSSPEPFVAASGDPAGHQDAAYVQNLSHDLSRLIADIEGVQAQPAGHLKSEPAGLPERLQPHLRPQQQQPAEAHHQFSHFHEQHHQQPWHQPQIRRVEPHGSPRQGQALLPANQQPEMPTKGSTLPAPKPQQEQQTGPLFSGVATAELQQETSRLKSAVASYRSSDFKKYKAMMATYRHLLHKRRKAMELRRRPYPPEPAFPSIKMPAMPETHSLEAKCYAAREMASSPPKSRLTIMNKRVYKPGSEIVTWVRTVGEVSDEFWQALPASDPFDGVRYRTCAVVASAGLMRNRLFGAQIDAHNAVIRFNSAYTRGMEQYVGSKTTIRLMNRENFGFTESPGEIVLQHITMLQMMADFASFRRLFPEVRLYAIHPAFYSRVVTEEVEHPSNGFFGLKLALELCDCVRMYGFVRSWQGYMTYHYHDDYTPRKSQHSRDSTEMPLIQGMLNEHLGRLAFAHPCILQKRCEGCPSQAAACSGTAPYPVPTPGHCYGHGPPGGFPVLNKWEPGKFWPDQIPDEGGRLQRAREVYQPYKSGMNDQRPELPFADERRSCFRECLPGDSCPGGPGGICPPRTAKERPCLPWRDVSPQLQGR